MAHFLNSRLQQHSTNIWEASETILYYIIDASNNDKICEIESREGDTVKQYTILHFKGMIEKELISKGKPIAPIQDQYLIYRNQIMLNHHTLNEYLGDTNVANIYLQHGIECIKCTQMNVTFNECKMDNHKLQENLKELNQKYTKSAENNQELIHENSRLESDVFDLQFQNNNKADKISSLQNELHKYKQELAHLREIEKQMIKEMDILKQKEIDGSKKEENRFEEFEDYVSYFGNTFPMEASILSYYEWIGLIIGLVFTNEKECKFGDKLVRWITFSLFLIIPFVIGTYRITQNSKINQENKWYRSLCQFLNEYSFRIMILLLLMLSSESKPISCFIEDETALQLSILVFGIFCLILHAMITKMKHTKDNGTSDVNESVIDESGTRMGGEKSISTKETCDDNIDEEPHILRQTCSVYSMNSNGNEKGDRQRYTALSISEM